LVALRYAEKLLVRIGESRSCDDERGVEVTIDD
jgi:hypothetical protein